MNTTTTQFLHSYPAMYTTPGRTYARVGVRDPARMYVRGRIFFLAHWPLYVRVHATCAPLLPHVRASTTTRALPYTATVHRCSLQTDRSTSMYVHICDQNDNATYASTRWVPTIRHFLAYEDVAGGSQQSGGKCFFTKYGGPSGGSPLSGGGIIILHVIRRHFLAAAVTQLSASPRTVLFGWKSVVDHIDHAAPRAPRLWMTAKARKGTTRSRGRRGSGRPRGEEYEGSLVRLRCEAAVATGPGQCWE
jgi:hypothetical protein